MKSYPLNQCLLYKMRSKKKLAKALELETSEIARIESWNNYTEFQQPKKSGGARVIYNPSPKLKKTQRRIKSLLERVERPDWVFSGAKGRCHVDNGRCHVGSSYFLCADIASFYDRCKRDCVYRFFRDVLHTAPDIACILTDLTTKTDDTHPDGFIPTGSPSGQIIAFFAYEDMFIELHDIAVQESCKFSLYVDDIAISSNTPMKDPRSIAKRLNKTLSAYGHSISWGKTRYTGKADSRIITGVAVTSDGAVHVPNRLGKNIVDGVREIAAGNEKNLPKTAGRIGAARQIEESAFPNAVRIVAKHMSPEI